jgi:hypothetical protein
MEKVILIKKSGYIDLLKKSGYADIFRLDIFILFESEIL